MEAKFEMERLFREHSVHPDVIRAVNNYVAQAEQEAYEDGYKDGQ